MAISKEQWEKIEERLASPLALEIFEYKSYKLTVHRIQISESKTELAVYINGCMNFGWGWQEGNRPKDLTPTPSIVADVWKLRTKAIYSPKEIKDLEKAFGKRAAKKQFPDLHAKVKWYVPLFSKASVLCRQFKQLDGLELKEDKEVIA